MSLRAPDLLGIRIVCKACYDIDSYLSRSFALISGMKNHRALQPMDGPRNESRNGKISMARVVVNLNLVWLGMR